MAVAKLALMAQARRLKCPPPPPGRPWRLMFPPNVVCLMTDVLGQLDLVAFLVRRFHPL